MNPASWIMAGGDKIVFMGTPEFSAAHLKALIGAEKPVVGVVSQPDRPKGRGRKLEPTPVKKAAMEHGIPVIQPKSLRAGAEPSEWVKKLNPDLLVVVAYGLILPPSMLEAAPGGAWNVHASLLPRYRGAAPIQWAIVKGEEKTGVTLMKMDAGMDTGDILLQEEVDIGPEETAGELGERLVEAGKRILLEGLRQREEGTLQSVKQDESLASYAPPIKKEDRETDWKDTAKNIHNKIRGFNPKPVARAGDIKLLRSIVRDAGEPDGDEEAKPGTITGVLPEGLLVATGQGGLLLTQVQPPGGRAMSAVDFAHGRHIKPGHCL